MKNAMVLLTFMTVYRNFCDAESLPEDAGDASVYITETFDSVRNYVTACDSNNEDITPAGIITAVCESIQTSNAFCPFSIGEFCACHEFILALSKAYNA